MLLTFNYYSWHFIRKPQLQLALLDSDDKLVVRNEGIEGYGEAIMKITQSILDAFKPTQVLYKAKLLMEDHPIKMVAYLLSIASRVALVSLFVYAFSNMFFVLIFELFALSNEHLKTILQTGIWLNVAGALFGFVVSLLTITCTRRSWSAALIAFGVLGASSFSSGGYLSVYAAFYMVYVFLLYILDFSRWGGFGQMMTGTGYNSDNSDVFSSDSLDERLRNSATPGLTSGLNTWGDHGG